MKTNNLLFLGIIISMALPALATTAPAGCEAKKIALHNQLEQARAQADTSRIRGLEIALGEVERYCNDDDLHQARLHKIAEKERKVAKRQQEFDEARRRGQEKEIDKKRKKLVIAQDELAEAREALLR